VQLDPEEWLDLTWWEEALQVNIRIQAFNSQQGTRQWFRNWRDCAGFGSFRCLP
jgi:hypothetical protein